MQLEVYWSIQGKIIIKMNKKDSKINSNKNNNSSNNNSNNFIIKYNKI